VVWILRPALLESNEHQHILNGKVLTILNQLVKCIPAQILLILFACFVIEIASGESLVRGEMATAIDMSLQRASMFGFSGAVLLSYKGEIILRKGYGFADRVQEIPITSDTAFAVASITKTFTAAAVLKLEQLGKLKTGDLINLYITEVPADKRAITIHHLLTHTSGIPDQYAASMLTDRDQAIRKILETKLVSIPGEKFNYSNDGYNLLAAIVEIVSGMRFQDFVRQKLLIPAGMTSTGFWGETNFLPENRVAHNYNVETDNGAPQFIQASWADRGSSDLITTVEDLYRWHLAFSQSKILPSKIVEKAYSRLAKRDTDWYYGYGWHHIITPRGTRDIYHGGGDYPRGVTAEFHRYIDEDIVTIAISNSMLDDAGLISIVRDPVRAVLFGGDCSTSPPAAAIAFDPSIYKGTYQISPADRILITFERKQLVARAEGQKAVGMLIGYKPELNAELEKLNQRVSVSLENASKGRFSPELSQEQWKEFLNRHVAFERFEILGTAPITPQELSTTYARLHFAKGSEVYRWVWRKGEFTQILSGTSYPAVASLVPLQPGKFIAYQLLMKTMTRLEFENDQLILQSQFGSATATK